MKQKRQILFRGRLETAEKMGERWRGRLVKVFCKDKNDIIKYSQLLKNRRWYVVPLFKLEKVEDISFITSMGVAVDLLYRMDGMEKKLALALAEYYLHHRDLKVPVEPFHSILMAKLEKHPLMLWHLHMKFPGGGVGNEESLKRYLDSIPKNQPECTACGHFHLCFGWGRYEKDSCETWKALLHRLQVNASEIKRLIGSPGREPGNG